MKETECESPLLMQQVIFASATNLPLAKGHLSAMNGLPSVAQSNHQSTGVDRFRGRMFKAG